MDTLEEPGKAVGKEIKRLRKSGRLDEAIALGERDLKENGDTARVLCSLGSAYLQKRQYADAERCFRETLALNPKNEVARTALGQAALAQHNYADAECCFRETLALNPKDEVARNALGQVALAQHNYADAECCFRETLALNPKNEVARNALGQVALAQHNYADAERCFRETLALNPKNEVARTALGQVALAQHNYADAERCFRETLALNPKNEVALLLSAKLALHQGDFPRALAIVSTQLKMRPHVPTMRMAQLMAEHGVGGRGWQQTYDSMLTIGKQAGLFTEAQARQLTRHEGAAQQPEMLSPEFFRQLDDVIGEVARSKLFAAAEIFYVAPVNAAAAKELGITAQARDSYRNHR